MKITNCCLFQDERLYSPSTGQIVYDPKSGMIDLQAKALIAAWNQEVFHQPQINDDVLRDEWHQYFDYYYFDTEEDETLLYQDILTNFLRLQENPDWQVYKCILYNDQTLPHCITLWCLVKADTALEPMTLPEVEY